MVEDDSKTPNPKPKKDFVDRISGIMASSAKISTAVCVILIVILFILLLYYRPLIQEWSKSAVENFGYPALFVLTLLSDLLTQPIPADFLVFGSNFGGASLWITAIVAGIASACGGTGGYFVAKWFGPWRFRKVFGSKILKSGRNLFKNHGALAVFVAGVTPIPYSAVCWIGGIYHMPVSHVFLASVVSRILRYLVVGWLTGIVTSPEIL